MLRRQFDGVAVSPMVSRSARKASTVALVDADDHDLLVRREPSAGGAVLLDQVREAGEGRARDPPDDRRDSDVVLAVLLRVHADVVARDLGRGGGGVRDEPAVEVLVLEHLAELLHAPVGDQELQPSPRSQPAVAVVAEDRDDSLPDVGDLLERDPHAELLREHRVGGEAAADPQVEARAVLGVHRADERHVIGLRAHVVARVPRQRGLELAGEVRERLVPDEAALDLLQRGAAVDDLVGGDAGDGGAEEGAGRVAARLLGLEAGGLEALPDRGHVLDADPVVLDVLAVRDVGGVTGELRRDGAEGTHRVRAQQRAVGAHAHHEVLRVEVGRVDGRGLAAVEALRALGVEPPPAHPAAEVVGVDRGEAALGVDALDPGPDVERVVVLLELLVRVQRLAVAECPLALAALGAGAGRCGWLPGRSWRDGSLAVGRRANRQVPTPSSG